MRQVNITSNGGQHMHANFICVNCNAISRKKRTLQHYNGCVSKEIYAFPSTSEAPKRNANKSKWRKFKDNNVFIEPTGWWWYFKESWFYNKFLKP